MNQSDLKEELTRVLGIGQEAARAGLKTRDEKMKTWVSSVRSLSRRHAEILDLQLQLTEGSHTEDLDVLAAYIRRIEKADTSSMPAKDVADDEARKPEAAQEDGSGNVRQVFVVHGRNRQIRDAMFEFLRSVELQPIEWEVAVQSTGIPAPFIGDVVSQGIRGAHAIIILLTGDDVARVRREFKLDSDGEQEVELTPQARPNVLFEAGMAFGFAEERTILIKFGDVRAFSDTSGRHYIDFDNSPAVRLNLLNKLESIGCPVNKSSDIWLTAGDFGAADNQDVDLAEVCREIGDTRTDLALRLQSAQQERSGGFLPHIGDQSLEPQPWVTAQALNALFNALDLQNIRNNSSKWVDAFNFLERNFIRGDEDLKGPGWPYRSHFDWSVTDVTCHAVLAAIEGIRAGIGPNDQYREGLRVRVEEELKFLVSLQKENGGWPPVNDCGSHVRTYSTACAVWVLAEAIALDDIKLASECQEALHKGMNRLLNTEKSGKGWEPRPDRKYTNAGYIGLTSFVLFVLTRAAAALGYQRHDELWKIRIDYLKNPLLRTTQVTDNDHTDNADVYLPTPSQRMLEPITFVWYPWALLNVVAICAEVDQLERSEAAVARGNLKQLFRQLPTYKKHLPTAYSFEVAEATFAFSVIHKIGRQLDA